jgi:RNase P subunit RPR2
MPEARGVIRKIAAKRIEILYDAAVKVYPKDQQLAKDYIKLVLEIGRHYKVKIPKRIAAMICKTCSLPLIEGVNSQTRVIAKEKRIIYRCTDCGETNSLVFGVKE